MTTCLDEGVRRRCDSGTALFQRAGSKGRARAVTSTLIGTWEVLPYLGWALLLLFLLGGVLGVFFSGFGYVRVTTSLPSKGTYRDHLGTSDRGLPLPKIPFYEMNKMTMMIDIWIKKESDGWYSGCPSHVPFFVS